MSLIVRSGDIALIRTRTKLRMGGKANVHAKRRIHSGKKTALYAGEMHFLEMLLLSLDEKKRK